MSSEFYQGSECRVIGPEGIANPAYGWGVPTIYRYNVETHDVTGGGIVARAEHGGGAYDFALLVAINGVSRLREPGGGPVTDLYERQASVVQHDQVDLSAEAMHVARAR